MAPDRPSGFGDVETDLQAPPPGYGPPLLRHRLAVRWTDARGAHSAVLDGRTVVGSAPSADLVVSDPAVSRLHAELDVRQDGVWLRDLGSKNGSFVEGVLVALARLPDRANVRLGSTVLSAEREATASPIELWPHDSYGPLLGGSAPMRELFARLARISPTDSTVLIQGETGTGKELVARAIHETSPRKERPFVIVDCAALPEGLLEAELFGHAKGAFTGAVAAREGAIESAEGGTVFLDEVGELPLSAQPKLLRVMESRTVRRVGETTHRKIDVRFLSGTNRDLRTMVNEGAFREDLYFRFAVLPVTVPPLRQRPADIPLLLQRFAPKGGPLDLPAELMPELVARPWLGNVRELRNFVERAAAFGAREALAMSATQAAPRTGDAWSALSAALDRPLREARETWIDTLEREYVARLLSQHARDVAAGAAAAGVDPSYIYRLIRKHGL
jgi:two-component system, NtrC family, response regulator GlrR